MLTTNVLAGSWGVGAAGTLAGGASGSETISKYNRYDCIENSVRDATAGNDFELVQYLNIQWVMELLRWC